MTNRPARPHKILDAAELEEWIVSNHPEIWDEWEDSDCCFEFHIDFWDWLDVKHWDILSEFEKWFRAKEKSTC